MRFCVSAILATGIIVLMLIAGCADVTTKQKVGDFGTAFGATADEQKAIEWFKATYGDPMTNNGDPARFVEPLITTGLSEKNLPADKVTTFPVSGGSVYFFVIYDNFRKGDPITVSWTYLENGKEVTNVKQEAGGDFGRFIVEFQKPDSGWGKGKQRITVTGDGAMASADFAIGDEIRTEPLPYTPEGEIEGSPGGNYATPMPTTTSQPTGKEYEKDIPLRTGSSEKVTFQQQAELNTSTPNPGPVVYRGSPGIIRITTTVTTTTTAPVISIVTTTPTTSPSANRAPIADTGGPYSVDIGDVLHLDASGSYDPDSGDSMIYQWDLDNDGAFDDGTGAFVSLPWNKVSNLNLYTLVGKHPVSLQVTDSHSFIATAETTLDIYDPNPIPSFAAYPLPAAKGDTITFDASASTAGNNPAHSIVSYEWIFHDYTRKNGRVVTRFYNQAGSYQVTLRITNEKGLISEQVGTVSIV